MNGHGKTIAVTLSMTEAEIASVITFLEKMRYRCSNAAQPFGMVHGGHASGHFSPSEPGPVAICETARDAFTHHHVSCRGRGRLDRALRARPERGTRRCEDGGGQGRAGERRERGMTINTRQFKLLWKAKGKVGLTETEFRTALVRRVGCTRTKELDQEGFTLMMGFFEWLGFKPPEHGEDYGARIDRTDGGAPCAALFRGATARPPQSAAESRLAARGDGNWCRNRLPGPMWSSTSCR